MLLDIGSSGPNSAVSGAQPSADNLSDNIHGQAGVPSKAVEDMFELLRAADTETESTVLMDPEAVKDTHGSVTSFGDIYPSMLAAEAAARMRSVAQLRKVPGCSATFAGWC